MAAIVPTGDIKECVGNSTSVYISKLVFKPRNDFPRRGNENYLYVATDEHVIYMWHDMYIPLTGSGSGTGNENGNGTGGGTEGDVEIMINDNGTSATSTWSSAKLIIELANKVNIEDVYTKDEVDEKIVDAGIDSEVATQTDIENLFRT